MSLPGSAHIPRNCEQSTTDRGNLKVNQSKIHINTAIHVLNWLFKWSTQLFVSKTKAELQKLTRRCRKESAALPRPPHLQMRSQTHSSSWLQSPHCRQTQRFSAESHKTSSKTPPYQNHIQVICQYFLKLFTVFIKCHKKRFYFI